MSAGQPGVGPVMVAVPPAVGRTPHNNPRQVAELAGRLDQLATTELDELRAEWRRLYRAPPPGRLSHDLLARGIADKLQQAAYGGLSAAHRRKLEAIGAERPAGAAAPPATIAARPRPGTRLLREWHGRSYSVTVLDGGFAFQGRRYASLSRIAREITGAQWSGPRFFGLIGSGATAAPRTGAEPPAKGRQGRQNAA